MSLQGRIRAARRRKIRYVTFCPDCRNPTLWTLRQAVGFRRRNPGCSAYRLYRKRGKRVMEEVR